MFINNKLILNTMKKSALTIVCALAVTGAAFAQGTVNWSSITPAAMTAQTNSTQYSPVFGVGIVGYGVAGDTAPASSGLIYYYELLYNTSFTGSQAPAPDAAGLFGGTWLDTGLTATNSNIAGRLVPVNPNLEAVVPWAQGTTNNIMLVGWSANLGTSWASVSNELAQLYIGNLSLLPAAALNGQYVFFGETATGFINPNLAPASGATLFAPTATANGSPIYSLNTQLDLLPMDLLPIPEPGTIMMVGFGGLSLWLFRRRK
jgi:hypothetical protein